MTEYQDALARVSSYYSTKNKPTIGTGGELSYRGGKSNPLLGTVARNKARKNIRGLYGTVANADLGVQASKIETDFLRSSITAIETKANEARASADASRAEFAKAKYTPRPTLGLMSFNSRPSGSAEAAWKEVEAGDSDALVARYEHESANANAGYHGAARFLSAHYGNDKDELFQAYKMADNIKKQNQYITSYDKNIADMQLNLTDATTRAEATAAQTRALLETSRAKALVDLTVSLKKNREPTTPIQDRATRVAALTPSISEPVNITPRPL